mmetsp:Transcript_138201/g.254230  ORF Transcript_138201/g.254230 Transcript_138201/m.254230 type:complete len:126 (+) Transcript_138201:858-1235(+)
MSLRPVGPGVPGEPRPESHGDATRPPGGVRPRWPEGDLQPGRSDVVACRGDPDVGTSDGGSGSIALGDLSPPAYIRRLAGGWRGLRARGHLATPLAVRTGFRGGGAVGTMLPLLGCGHIAPAAPS